MTPWEQRIERHAVKSGIKAAKRRHHLLSEEELRGLKVQVLSNLTRIILGILSLACATAAAVGWPSDANAVQAVLIFASIAFLIFATFGIRRVLGEILAQMTVDGAIELVGNVLGGIADATDL